MVERELRDMIKLKVPADKVEQLVNEAIDLFIEWEMNGDIGGDDLDITAVGCYVLEKHGYIKMD